MLRTIARRAALALPPVRRFYDYAQRLREERDRLAADHARLQAAASGLERERDALARDLDEARAAARAASHEREEIELRLYVLQSDFQRSVSAAETTRAMLRGVEEALERLRSAHEVLAAEGAECARRLAASERSREGAERALEALRRGAGAGGPAGAPGRPG